MLDKKKLHFWQLVLVFGAITVFALAYAYGYSYENQAAMMNTSMGNMMGAMHLKNATIGDLIRQQEQMDGSPAGQGQDHASHHGENSSFLKVTHYLTTATIILLLPFIAAGTVFLAIIWLK